MGDGHNETFDDVAKNTLDGMSKSLTHSYTSEGSYHITVKVTDSANKETTLTDTIKVETSTATTEWIADVHDLDTDERASDIAIIVDEIESNGKTYGKYHTNWSPTIKSDSTEYFVKYRLPIPSKLLMLDKKMRVTVQGLSSDIEAYDREINFKTSDSKEYTASIRHKDFEETLPNGTTIKGGYFTTKDLSTGTITKEKAEFLNSEYIPLDGVYAMATTPSSSLNVYSYDGNYTNLFPKTINLSGNWLTELDVTFKGNGVIKLVLIEYDLDGNGKFDSDEKLVLSTANKRVDWSTFGANPKNHPPTAKAGADQTIQEDETVTLDASKSSDAEDDIDSLDFVWKEGDDVLGTDKIITLNDLSVGTHTITLTVADTEGASSSDEVIVIITTKPTLLAPTNLTATPTEDSITLNWDDVEGTSAYKVCRSTSFIVDGDKCVENGGKIINGGTSTQITISNDLEQDTTYYFRVRGVKSGYVTLWSEEVSSKLVKPTPKISTSILKKTGQSIAYAKYDDGFYEKGATPNYTQETADVLDRMTGLVWQDNSHTKGDNKLSWSDAKSYCENLIGDWRLPTREELSGLVRYDKYNPSIDEIFDDTTADYYWSGDISLRDENKVWVVSFSEGVESTVAKTANYNVRCLKKRSSLVANAGADQTVKEKQLVTLDGSHTPNKKDIVSYKWSENAKELGEGEQFPISTLPDGVHKITLTIKDKNGKTDSDEVVITVTSKKDVLKKTSQNISYAKFDDGFYEKGVALNYAKSGDNILDKSTGLIWQDSDSGKKIWREAESYCSSLDGHWRLPTRKELSNLVSYNRYNPSIDDIFSSTFSDYYWTTDISNRDHNNAWAISFSEGVESAVAKSSSYYVRCVQSNLEPIANAGVDQLVVEGKHVTLRATESSRPELIKSYVWLEGNKELGQGAVFESNNMIDGEHEITLVIKDENGNEISRDSLVVTIISDNRVLKKTGQNISYAKFDDGYYERGIALNYTKRDDDILDRTTGLLWQDTEDTKSETYLWQDAKEYWASLDGHRRLPTRKE